MSNAFSLTLSKRIVEMSLTAWLYQMSYGSYNTARRKKLE